MSQQNKCCRDCRYCFTDRRSTPYRRDTLYFCQKKGCFFSRNYKVGEKTRVSGDTPACPLFEPNESGGSIFTQS